MTASTFRPARTDDLQDIVRMLADDPLGSGRERLEEPVLPSYVRAFEAIERDPNNELLVAVDDDDRAIAVLQVTFTPFITRQGGWRASIEGVRVERRFRSSGVGRRLVEVAVDRARGRGCHLVQLTSDKRRPEAIRFYERLGFRATHEGMKLALSPAPTPDGAD
jgi:ribosomal protein S18 acetylase RimI-like enzyme